ncbi:hypothetical protein JOE66_002999 [Subtercola frigoramans]|uniref:Secreted protein n=1 Tax=Subtercola frigoramans TaxID=120298 RepID=A0ABS2L8E2_9MICO|nr:hypothetical protein [Subtercola frigoramans]MBM7473365.1 hypothetical protein [Subtercola frigoramans]
MTVTPQIVLVTVTFAMRPSTVHAVTSLPPSPDAVAAFSQGNPATAPDAVSAAASAADSASARSCPFSLSAVDTASTKTTTAISTAMTARVITEPDPRSSRRNDQSPAGRHHSRQ